MTRVHLTLNQNTVGYALESKQNNYIPSQNHRELFAPISGTVIRYPHEYKITITAPVQEGEATVELLHVDPNEGPQTGEYVQAGQRLQAMTFKGEGYGDNKLPHLHLSLQNNGIYRNPLPIADSLGDYWAYRDPNDGLYLTDLPEGY